jgi:hypothetical protein
MMMSREELLALIDEELLAFYRQRYPYLPLSIAKELRRADLKYWHLSAIAKKKEREAKEEELRRLHAKVFPASSSPSLGDTAS